MENTEEITEIVAEQTEAAEDINAAGAEQATPTTTTTTDEKIPQKDVVNPEYIYNQKLGFVKIVNDFPYPERSVAPTSFKNDVKHDVQAQQEVAATAPKILSPEQKLDFLEKVTKGT